MGTLGGIKSFVPSEEMSDGIRQRYAIEAGDRMPAYIPGPDHRKTRRIDPREQAKKLLADGEKRAQRAKAEQYTDAYKRMQTLTVGKALTFLRNASPRSREIHLVAEERGQARKGILAPYAAHITDEAREKFVLPEDSDPKESE